MVRCSIVFHHLFFNPFARWRHLLMGAVLYHSCRRGEEGFSTGSVNPFIKLGGAQTVANMTVGAAKPVLCIGLDHADGKGGDIIMS
jgi:hypothetical protein